MEISNMWLVQPPACAEIACTLPILLSKCPVDITFIKYLTHNQATG